MTSEQGRLFASLLSPPGTPSVAITLYWLVAVPLALVLVPAYHRHRGARTGLMARSWPASGVGLGVLAFLALTSKAVRYGVFHAYHLPGWLGFVLAGDLSLRGLAPLVAMAASLLVLAQGQRSRQLRRSGLCFLVLALVANGYDIENLLGRVGWFVGFGAHRLPNLDLPGLVLLLGGLGFLLRDHDLEKKGRLPVPDPSGEIDDVVHQRVRLGILTTCNEVPRVEFSFLRDNLGLTAGNLSRHLAVLEEADLIKATKTSGRGRPRTWMSITPAGRVALAQEVAALRAIVERVEAANTATRATRKTGRSAAPSPGRPSARPSVT